MFAPDAAADAADVPLDDVLHGGAHDAPDAAPALRVDAGPSGSFGIPPAALVVRHFEPEWVRECADKGWLWVRVYWQRACANRNAFYDPGPAEFMVANWPRFFTLTDDRFAGQPFRLMPWQAAIVRFVFGWYHRIEVLSAVNHKPEKIVVRLFRQLDLWIARRNGKSEFMAALALAFFMVSPTQAGRGFNFARTEEQARIVFDKMDAMIGANTAWAKNVQVQRRNITDPRTRSIWLIATGSGTGKHGRGPSVIVGDEIHEWKTADLYKTLQGGTGSRTQPFEIYASTAGTRSKSPVGHEFFRQSQAVLQGRIFDPGRLVAMFAAYPDADWQDESNWPAANPNIGLSPTWDFLRRQCAEAKLSQAAELRFRAYHLNQWVDGSARWLHLAKWDACSPAADWHGKAERLAGRKAILGWDISSTKDFTALAALLERPDAPDTFDLLVRLWLPEARVDVRSKSDPRFEQWVRMGAIEVTEGDTVDQNAVMRAVLEWSELFDVEAIGFDRFESQKLLTDLQEEGIDPDLFFKVPMSVSLLDNATKAFETAVNKGRMDHGGHPVLRWMAENTDVRFDQNMSYMPSKKHSDENIDGIMAAVFTMHVRLDRKPDTKVTGADILTVL